MIDRSHSATGAMVAIVPKFPKLLEMLILLPADRDNSGWTPPPLMDKANDPSLLLPAFTANVSVSYSIIISNRHIVIFTRIASVSDRANAHFPSSRVQQTFSLPFSICTISHRRSHLRCPLQFYHQHYCHFTAHRWNRHCCCYQSIAIATTTALVMQIICQRPAPTQGWRSTQVWWSFSFWYKSKIVPFIPPSGWSHSDHNVWCKWT